MNTQHLGDGVYIDYDGYGFNLMANDHTNPTDTIYLEPDVFRNLQRYVENSIEELKKANEAK